MKGVPYSKAIGSVLWPVVVLRPDAAYAVGILSQFIQNPGQAHWEGVKRVISYLGSTKTLWLTFGGTKETLIEGYCNADWASQSHCHSISGFSFHYGCGAVVRGPPVGSIYMDLATVYSLLLYVYTQAVHTKPSYFSFSSL